MRRAEYPSQVDPFAWPPEGEEALGPYPTADDIDWNVEP